MVDIGNFCQVNCRGLEAAGTAVAGRRSQPSLGGRPRDRSM